MAESQLIGGGTQPPRRPTAVLATSQAYRSQPVEQALGVFRPAPEAPKRKINPLGMSGLCLASVPFLRLYARVVFGY